MCLRRPCKRCEVKFQPTTFNNKFCDNCRRDIQKETTIKIREIFRRKREERKRIQKNN